MKILGWSDLHLHNWPKFGLCRELGMPRRLQEQVVVLKKLNKICKDRGIKHREFGGDYFIRVEEIPVEALTVAEKFYNDSSSLNILDRWTGGNHDVIDRESPKWFQIVSNLFSKFVPEETINGFKIRRVSYYDKVDYSSIKGYDLVILHKTPAGAVVNNYTFEEGVDWKLLSKHNKMVWFGHIHQPQRLADNVFVLGSVMPLTHGDKKDRGVYILDTDTMDVEFIKIDSPKFITVDTVKDLDKFSEEERKCNYFRVLHAEKKIDEDNIVGVKVPEYFDVRIKATGFNDILSEWLTMKGKESSYMNILDDVIREVQSDKVNLFKGRLTKVEIDGFLSIKNTEYDVKNGFNLVLGENRDEGGSNGSGKSSGTGEAIFWCFFGKTGKKLKGTDVVNEDMKDAFVRVTLEDKDVKYEISRKSSFGLIIDEIKNGETTRLTKGLKRAAREELLVNHVLGVNEEMFQSACYFSQEGLVMLTGLGDTGRTNMINRLLGFDVYDKMSEKLFVVQKDIVEEIEDVENKVNKINSYVDVLNAELVNLKEMKDNFINEEKKQEKYKKVLEDEVDSLRVETEKEPEYKVDKQDFGYLIDSSLVAMKELKTRQEELSVKDRELGKEMEDVVGVSAGMQKEIELKEVSIREIEHSIKQTKDLELGQECDKCGSVIEKKNIEKYVKNKKIESDKIEEEIKVLKEKIEGVGKKKEKIWEDRCNVRASVENVKKKINRLDEEVVGLRKDKEVQEEKIREWEKRLVRIEEEKKNKNLMIDKCKEEIERAKNSGKDMDKRMVDKNKEIRDKEKECGELVSVRGEKEDKIERINFWRDSFSAGGIKALLLDRFCNEYNSIVNMYLTFISNGNMNLVVSPTAELKSGEQRNKLGIIVSIGERERKYEALSGGEKKRVDVALCLGLNKWFGNKNGIDFGYLGWIGMDEVFDHVDRPGEDALGTLLYHEGVNKAIYIVSHTPSLGSYADKVMKFIKENGATKLEILSEH